MIAPVIQRILDEDLSAIAATDLPWERLAGCRVAVTGAGGFLGSYLVRSLLALNQQGKLSRPVQVVAMVRDLARARSRFSDVEDAHLEFMHWDLTAFAIPDLGNIQYVIHAASQASPRFYGKDPVGTLLPNTVGTAALLEALRASADPRGMLFISSSEVYGAVSSSAAIAEDANGVVDPATVRACYAESKRAGETMCVAWHAQHGIPTFIARPFHTYGPGLTSDDGRVFADFAFNVARGEDIVMKSDGSARRAFCYVTDAIAGFLTVLLQGTPATPYNVANSDAELSIMELADLMIGLFPERGLRVQRQFDQADKGYLASNVNRIVPDMAKLHALGWRSNVDAHTGFRRMVEACDIGARAR